VTNAKESYRNREIPTDEEIEETLKKSEMIPSEYFRLRVRALISLAKKFGKRRAEIGSLLINDLEVKEGYLFIKFLIRKKHKKGLFQYLKLLRKENPEALGKPLTQLEVEWKEWQTTEQGYRVKEERRTKKVSLEDKYARLILEYVDYLRKENPEGIYLFPSGKAVFDRYFIRNKAHLSGSQLLRLIKPLNSELWLHLLRETKGAEIARDLGNSVTAVAAVKQTLDLEREETAWHYIERYAAQTMKPEP
jgi:integrase